MSPRTRIERWECDHRGVFRADDGPAAGAHYCWCSLYEGHITCVYNVPGRLAVGYGVYLPVLVEETGEGLALWLGEGEVTPFGRFIPYTPSVPPPVVIETVVCPCRAVYLARPDHLTEFICPACDQGYRQDPHTTAGWRKYRNAINSPDHPVRRASAPWSDDA